MVGKSCAVVLTGAETAFRPWIKYEIQHAWEQGKGVVAIRIHRLLGTDSLPSIAGPNPLDYVSIGKEGKVSKFARIKEPIGTDSKAVYRNIADNIESWIEEAISIRSKS